MAEEVAELLRYAQEVDEEEDRRYGKDKRGRGASCRRSWPSRRVG